MGKRLRTGLVATLRVSPKDAQSILHVLEKAGIKRGMNSFSVCVSDALRVLLESSRQGGIIPEPDAFNFINELQDFVGDNVPDKRTKSVNSIGAGSDLNSKVKQAVEQAKAQAKFVDTPEPSAAWIDPAIPTDPEKLMEYKAAIARLSDAQNKKNLAEQNTPDVYWSDKDEADFQRDIKLVYG